MLAGYCEPDQRGLAVIITGTAKTFLARSIPTAIMLGVFPFVAPGCFANSLGALLPFAISAATTGRESPFDSEGSRKMAACVSFSDSASVSGSA